MSAYGTEPRSIRIVLACDYRLAREGMAALLSQEVELTVVGQAADGLQALRLIQLLRPDVALLDIDLPGMSGMAVAQQLSGAGDAPKVLLLTLFDEEAFFVEALQCGAAGYLVKGSSREELVGAIRSAHAEGIFLPPRLAASLVGDFLQRYPASSAGASLSPPETKVLALLEQGMNTARIAEAMALSIDTVQNHQYHICDKLKLLNQEVLHDYALRRSLA